MNTLQTHTLIIGAASGMGQCIAKQLSKTGKLSLADINLQALNNVAQEFGALAYHCDITDHDSVKNLAASCQDIDSVVITAGVSPMMASSQQIIDVDFVGTARCIETFRDHIKPGGAMVCISSIAGHMFRSDDPKIVSALDNPFSENLVQYLQDAGLDINDPNVAYGIAKFGVIHTCKKTAKSWAKRQIRLNSLSPGIISTPMGNLELQEQPDTIRPLIEMTPLQRMGAPEEIADCVEFLLSKKASFITGTDILVDGGITSCL